MRYFPILFAFLISGSISCNKTENTEGCSRVIITQTGTPCSQWGIQVNGNTYASRNIPAEFKLEGIAVCASYDLFDDMTLCACCGGTWADIKSMKRFVR